MNCLIKKQLRSTMYPTTMYSWVKKYKEYGPDGLSDVVDGVNLVVYKQMKKVKGRNCRTGEG